MDQELLTFMQQQRTRLREEQVPIYVTKGCCKECFFFSQALIPAEVKEELINHCLTHETFVECHTITFAQNCGYAVPELVCCFAFFYNYLERIPMLQDAREDGRLHFFAIDSLPGAAASGRTLTSDKFNNEKYILMRKREEIHDE